MFMKDTRTSLHLGVLQFPRSLTVSLLPDCSIYSIFHSRLLSSTACSNINYKYRSTMRPINRSIVDRYPLFTWEYPSKWLLWTLWSTFIYAGLYSIRLGRQLILKMVPMKWFPKDNYCDMLLWSVTLAGWLVWEDFLQDDDHLYKS